MNYPKNIFRAYDIRGKYPSEINESVVTAIAGTLADYFSSQNAEE